MTQSWRSALRSVGFRGRSAQGHADRQLFDSTHEPDSELAGTSLFERVMQLVRIRDRGSTSGNDQVAFANAGFLGRAAFLDAANQHAVTVWKTHGPAQVARYVAWGNRYSEPRSNGRFTAPEGVDSGSQAFVGRECEVETLAQPLRVQAEQSPFHI
jgi:hypothetical protein